MRTAHRTLAEHRPIRRNVTEKRQQLRDLCETAARLKPHTTPALRHSIQRRIYDLRQELRREIPSRPASSPSSHRRAYVLHAD